MTARDVLARMLGGYGPDQTIPEHGYLRAGWTIETLEAAGFTVERRGEAAARPVEPPRNTGPGWGPHNRTIKLPRSVTHPLPRSEMKR